MPLESGTVIRDLDKTSPNNDDDIEKGDEHLRLVKSVLQSQFPGSGGAGFSKPITASEDEINFNINLRDNVQVQMDALEARIVALGG